MNKGFIVLAHLKPKQSSRGTGLKSFFISYFVPVYIVSYIGMNAESYQSIGGFFCDVFTKLTLIRHTKWSCEQPTVVNSLHSCTTLLE